MSNSDRRLLLTLLVAVHRALGIIDGAVKTAIEELKREGFPAEVNTACEPARRSFATTSPIVSAIPGIPTEGHNG